MPQENPPDRRVIPSDIAAPTCSTCTDSGSLPVHANESQPQPQKDVLSDGDSRGKLPGRPSSLERLGITREDIWSLASQGLSNVQITKHLIESKGKICVRTVATYRSQMPSDYLAQIEDFDKVSRVGELRNWINSRYSARNNSDNTISRLKRIWEACWRKPLESIDESDLVKAIAWINENHSDAQFDWIISIRYMIRSGIGQPYWLTKHLSTKGKKAPPRTLAILNSPNFFHKTLPMIYREIGKLTNLSQRQRDELLLVLMLKATTGIRTGAMKRRKKLLEQELWGTRLGAGKSNLQIVNGQFTDWIVRAKKNEAWHIRYLPPKVMRLLLSHVARYQIRQGEALIQELRIVDALKALKRICINLDLPPLILHDFRKVYLTALCLAGVPLETAVELNVGWLDLNTARKHYLHVKAMNADAEYAKMSERFFK